MAEQLQGALAARGIELCIINMTGGGDIDTAVFQTIEACDTFLVFGSAKYGETPAIKPARTTSTSTRSTARSASSSSA